MALIHNGIRINNAHNGWPPKNQIKVNIPGTRKGPIVLFSIRSKSPISFCILFFLKRDVSTILMRYIPKKREPPIKSAIPIWYR